MLALAVGRTYAPRFRNERETIAVRPRVPVDGRTRPAASRDRKRTY